MKKAFNYLLIMAFAVVNFSATLKNENGPKQNLGKITQLNETNLAPFGSYYTTIINQSSNVITKIVVQQIYNPGNSVSTTYNNPPAVLQVPANGTVTITVYFVNPGPTGTLKLYREYYCCGFVFNFSEDYNPRYLSPVSYSAIRTSDYSGNWQLIISNS